LIPVKKTHPLAALAEEHVRIARPCGVNARVKIPGIVAGMTGGADSIDDLGLLRQGAMPALFGGVRAPSTLGSFLRSFTWGNVLQLGKVHRLMLAELARRAPLLPGKDVLAFIDIDSQQKRVYGRRKQGAAFGHTKIQGKSLLVRGLNALVATISTPLGAPVIAGTRLRGGNAASARGAASFAAEAVRTAHGTGCSGTVVVRADSAFYSAAFTRAVRAAGAFFSVTVPMNPHVAAAIAAISEDAWQPICYPRAIWDDQLGCWVSDAEVAETRYTAFTRKKGQEITARLIIRRVRDLNKQAGQGQDELFPAWRYHAVFTDSPFTLIQAEEQHRDHAQVEQVLADWTDGPLAHLPYVGVLPGQRRLAGPRRDQSQPAARRRLPGQPGLRQGPRRHDPPRPHRRRRPHRPPRPRPHHLAPARSLAPRARMAEPVHSRLRPAARSGLTSPDRSRPFSAARPATARHRARNPGKPQEQRAAAKPRPRSQS
jgi:Transposase DDE domain group 1